MFLRIGKVRADWRWGQRAAGGSGGGGGGGRRVHGKPWLPSQAAVDECLGFDLSLNRNELLHLFSADLKRYISSNEARDSYFTDLPRPIDKGKFLGMEIREKSLHLSCVELDGRNLDERANKFELKEHVDLKQTNKLLEEIIEGVNKFMRENGLESATTSTSPAGAAAGRRIPLGITLCQLHHTGRQADQLAQSELFRKLKQHFANNQKVNVEVKAVISESTATLMTGHWINHNITSGLVLGGGTEVSYLEEREEEDGVRVRSHRLEGFGEQGELDYLRTQHDVSLDLDSTNPGLNRLGKLVMGGEVAELVRLVIVKLVQDGSLYSGQLTAPLMTPGALTAAHLAAIEKDAWGKQEHCVKVLSDLHVDWPHRQDCVDTRHVVESLTRRAAHVSAGLIASIPPSHSGASIEGSLPAQLPGFIPALQHKTGQLRPREMKVIQIPRSSVIGAALLAARLASLETSL